MTAPPHESGPPPLPMKILNERAARLMREDAEKSVFSAIDNAHRMRDPAYFTEVAEMLAHLREVNKYADELEKSDV